MALTYFKTPLEPHAVHQSRTTKTDGRWKEAPGERGLYLSFTATMEHVRFVLLLLFTHTVCISLLENYITSCLRAIDWVYRASQYFNGCFLGKLLHERGPTDPGVWQMHHSNRKREVRLVFPPIPSGYFVVFCCFSQSNIAVSIQVFSPPFLWTT